MAVTQKTLHRGTEMNEMTRRDVLKVTAGAGVALLGGSTARVTAQENPRLSPNVAVFATGLDNPRGLEFAPNGHLYVAEAGRGGTSSTQGLCPQVPPPIGPFTGGYTGRISRINPAGQRHTVVDRLPSAQTSPLSGSDVLGPSAVAFVRNDLYVLVQAGCTKGLRDAFNAVLRVNPNRSLTTIANLSEHNQDVFVGPPDEDHDPEGNPFGMARVGNALYVVEANHGAVDQVELDGTVTRVVDITALRGHITPTAIAAGPDGDLYVGNIDQFPYLDGTAKVFRITPDGQFRVVAENLTAVFGLAFDPHGRLYVLESVTGSVTQPPFIFPGTGRILRLSNAGQETVASGLTFPSAMTFGPDNHLYVSHKGYAAGPVGGHGEVLRVDVGLPRH